MTEFRLSDQAQDGTGTLGQVPGGTVSRAVTEHAGAAARLSKRLVPLEQP